MSRRNGRLALPHSNQHQQQEGLSIHQPNHRQLTLSNHQHQCLLRPEASPLAPAIAEKIIGAVVATDRHSHQLAS